MSKVLGLRYCLGGSAALCPGSSELRLNARAYPASARRRGSSLPIYAKLVREPIKLFERGTPEYERLKTAKRIGGDEYFKEYYAEFGPATKRADNVLVLEFEKPLIALEKKIDEVSGFRFVKNICHQFSHFVNYFSGLQIRYAWDRLHHCWWRFHACRLVQCCLIYSMRTFVFCLGSGILHIPVPYLSMYRF